MFRPAPAAPDAARSPNQPVDQSGRPRRPLRRRMSAAKAMMSAQARQAQADAERRQIEEFLTSKGAEKCPTRWALGAVSSSLAAEG